MKEDLKKKIRGLVKDQNTVDELMSLLNDSQDQHDLPSTGLDRQYDVLAEHMPGWVLELDGEGRILYVNRRMGQKTPDQLTGTVLVNHLSKDNQNNLQDALYEVFENGQKQHIRFIENGVADSFSGITFEIRPLNKNGNVESVLLISHSGDKQEDAPIHLETEKGIAKKYLDQIGVMVIAVNPKKEVILANDMACQILGYSEKEIIGKNWIEHFIPKKLQNNTNSLIDSFLKNEAEPVVYNENPILTKTGEEKIISWHNKAILDDKGKVEAFLCSGEDITTKRKAEKDLQKSRQDYGSLVNAIEGIVWEADPKNLSLNFVSEQVERLLGYSVNEWLKKNKFWEDHIHPDDKVLALAAYHAVVEEMQSQTIEYRMLSSTGEIIWIKDFVKVQVEDGIATKVQGIMVNNSEQKHVEQSLEQSEKKYRSLFENANDSVFITDPETHSILDANEVAADRLGYTLEELLKLTIDQITPDDGQNDLGEIRSTMNEQGHSIFQTYHRKKDGSTFPIEVSSKTIEWEGIVAFQNFVRDITARKEAEDLLKRKNIELNSFIYKASHDLKGPLASIQGLVNVAETEIEDKSAFYYLDLIRKCAERLENNLTDLIMVTRIKHSGLQATDVDVKELIDEILMSLQQYPNYENMKFNLNFDHNVAFRSDMKLITSIFQNFISNAIKYSTGTSRDPELTISTRNHLDGIELVFEDNGLGIPEESQKKIFDMFFRAHQQLPGNGLGLYIVKSAIEKMGGTIELWSEDNVGTKFTIYLPVLQDVEGEQEET